MRITEGIEQGFAAGEDVLALYKAGKLPLNEASLNRLFRHMGGDGFAIVTAWRDVTPTKDTRGVGEGVDRKENARNMAGLKADLRSGGFGFVPVTGVFPGGQEPSLFVPVGKKDPDALKSLAVKLGKKYTQWGVIWGDGKKILGIATYDVENDKAISPKVTDRWSGATTNLGPFYSAFKQKQGHMGPNLKPTHRFGDTKSSGTRVQPNPDRGFSFESEGGVYFARPASGMMESQSRYHEGEILLLGVLFS